MAFRCYCKGKKRNLQAVIEGMRPIPGKIKMLTLQKTIL